MDSTGLPRWGVSLTSSTENNDVPLFSVGGVSFVRVMSEGRIERLRANNQNSYFILPRFSQNGPLDHPVFGFCGGSRGEIIHIAWFLHDFSRINVSIPYAATPPGWKREICVRRFVEMSLPMSLIYKMEKSDSFDPASVFSGDLPSEPVSWFVPDDREIRFGLGMLPGWFLPRREFIEWKSQIW